MDLNELNDLDFFEDDHVTQAEEELNLQQLENDDLEEQDQLDDDSSNDNEDVDVLLEFLSSKGIDINSIKMQNDDGDTEEFNFNDLSREDQLLILNYNPAQPNEESNSNLAEDEEKLLDILRQNNMSVLDYLNAYRRHVIEQYQAENPIEKEETFDIDQYTDEELFIADLKDKVPDLTEEEALQELQMQQQNPELFQKKVNGLRAQYQEREKQVKDYEAQLLQAQLAQLAAQFEQVIVDTISNNGSIDLGDTSLELSEDDMNEIASFILDSDPAGVRYIAKALNDPKMLVEMAWWALKGHDALNQVTQYYKKQISEARKSAKLNMTPSKPRTVVTKRNKTNTTNESDLFDNLV